MSRGENWIDPAVASRLKEAQRRWGRQEELAEKSGVRIGTLQNIIQGKTDPSLSNVAAIARALGLSLDYVLYGIGPETGDETTEMAADTDYVPVYDLEVSAGGGSEAFDAPPVGHFGFARNWLTRRFGGPHNLAICRVRGDSMATELMDGDVLMIDRSDRTLRDGLFAVQLDGLSMIKRVQCLPGDRLLLLSSNPAYQPIEVDLGSQATFNVHGRAVWIGRNL